MHSLLGRQIRRTLGTTTVTEEPWRGLLEAVDAAYTAFEADRTLLERSLDLSSRELLRANSEMQAILVTFPDLFFRIETGGTILDCRGGGGTDFIVRPESLIGKKIHAVPNAEASRRFREALRSLRRTGEPTAIEYSLNRAEETPTYEARFVPLSENQALVIVRNITQRKKSESALESSLSLLMATLESTADGILVVDGQGRIASFNQRFVDMWRIPPDIIASRNDGEALAFVLDQLTDPNGFLVKVRELYACPDAESYDVLPFKDGRVFERYSKPQKIAGDCVGRVWSFRDVTEQRRIQEALRLEKEKAEAASRAKSEFLATMSHEIRTPMNAVIGMTELALDTKLDEEQRDYLETVKSSAMSLLAVINDVLDFSKIEAGKLDLVPEPFALRACLAETMKTLGARTREKRIELLCRVDPQVPDELVGDICRLRQVIVNLVGNAIKFTSKGAVTLSVMAAGNGPSDRARRLEFVVQDTGIGIPSEKLGEILKPFTQADSTLTRKYGGTGLGLAISCRLIEMMEGELQVESEFGAGSTFRFTALFGVGETVSLPASSAGSP